MNKMNLEAIKARLVSLGFDHEVEEKLMTEICFSPSVFDVRFVRPSGLDEGIFLVHIERGTSGEYAVMHYTATLRKTVVLPPASQVMAERMGKIDWKLIASYRGSSFVTIDLSILKVAFGVLQESAKLAEYPLILYKYWAGTSLEALVPGIVSLKSKYELSQRFYVSEEHTAIRSDEAIRFLQNRWTERQMQQGRLQRRQAEGGQNQSASVKGNKRKTVRKK